MFKINVKYENIIKEYFKNDFSINKIQTRAPKFLKNHLEIVEYLQQYLEVYPNWETIKHILYKIVLNIQLPKCLGCGKELTFSKRNKKYCSLICCNSSKIFLEHKKECVLKKYGVLNVLQSEIVKTKIDNTIHQHVLQDKFYWKKRQEKTNKTKIIKYRIY